MPDLIDLVLQAAPSLVKVLSIIKKEQKSLNDTQLLCVITAATYEQLQRNNALLQTHCDQVTKAINGFRDDVAILKSRTERRS